MKQFMLSLDKANHATWGNVAALAGFGLSRLLGGPAYIWSAGITAAVAVAKEVIDCTVRGKKFSPDDVAVTLFGGAPVSIVCYVLE